MKPHDEILAYQLFIHKMFRSVFKNFATSWENICDGVLLKKSQVATWLRKVFIKGSIPWKLGNFSGQILPRTTFGECFCFRSCPCRALSSKCLVHQTNKHPLRVVRAVLGNSFPKKVSGALLEKMSAINKLKLSNQGSNIFLEHIQLFQGSYSVDFMQITSSVI